MKSIHGRTDKVKQSCCGNDLNKFHFRDNDWSVEILYRKKRNLSYGPVLFFVPRDGPPIQFVIYEDDIAAIFEIDLADEYIRQLLAEYIHKAAIKVGIAPNGPIGELVAAIRAWMQRTTN